MCYICIGFMLAADLEDSHIYDADTLQVSTHIHTIDVQALTPCVRETSEHWSVC